MKKKTMSLFGWGVLILIVGLSLSQQPCFSDQNVRSAIDSGVVVAKARTITTRLSAYARVEPITVLKLNAAQTGIVTGMTVLPGEMVKAGMILGRLTGPAVNGLLAQRRSSVANADAALSAAEKIFAVERKKQGIRLATRKAVYQAEAALAKARADLDNARSQLQAAQESVVLKAPGDGRVLAVNAAEGEQVQAGGTILTLQPAGGLWLLTYFYGSDATAIRVGMTGQFEPAAGGSSIPVKVSTVIGPIGPDSGQAAGLVPTVSGPRLLNGEAGRVTLSGAKRTFVAVPTRALILDKGRWWVLVRTKHGTRRREVIPGTSEGTSTLIKQGLEPGTRVVVENAYLEFHRDFSRHYNEMD